jgi:hypothetical protein
MKHFNEIREHILQTYKIDITNKTRRQPTTYLRGATAYILSSVYRYPDGLVAGWLGIDRTSALYHRQSHGNKYLYDSWYADLYDELFKFVIEKKDGHAESIKNRVREVFEGI